MKQIGLSIAYAILGTVLMASGAQLIANAAVGATSDSNNSNNSNSSNKK